MIRKLQQIEDTFKIHIVDSKINIQDTYFSSLFQNVLGLTRFLGTFFAFFNAKNQYANFLTHTLPSRPWRDRPQPEKYIYTTVH